MKVYVLVHKANMKKTKQYSLLYYQATHRIYEIISIILGKPRGKIQHVLMRKLPAK